jgi:hypothetical protein
MKLDFCALNYFNLHEMESSITAKTRAMDLDLSKKPPAYHQAKAAIHCNF